MTFIIYAFKKALKANVIQVLILLGFYPTFLLLLSMAFSLLDLQLQ